VREGFDKASTNRIAEVAGVSVGSLYQYFPGKEALVAAVIERHQQEIIQLVRGELAKVADRPIEQGLRTLVAAGVKAHRLDPKLHRVLAEQIPRVGKLEKLETFNRENYTLFRMYLESHHDAPDRGIERGERATQVHSAIEKLAPDLRECVILRDIEELTYQEIVDILRIPIGTVKSRINRGRIELAKILRRMKVVEVM